MKKIKLSVQKAYSAIAKGEKQGCCGPVGPKFEYEEKIGYDLSELKSLPEGAVLGVGCGNPVALASLREGETVLDLGSGAGIDVFLAAGRVGAGGKVIGVDMTPEMLERAGRNAEAGGFANVEFRRGEIENLPVEDGSVDCVISNCVINLSVDKERTFKEAFRVLRPGGRLMVSDIVLTRALPDDLAQDAAAYAGCISGAVMQDEYMAAIKTAGFKDIEIMSSADASFLAENPCKCKVDTSHDIAELGLKSIKVRAYK